MAIGGTVGEGGVNDEADVFVVQSLLNNWLASVGLNPIPVDGDCGPDTIDTIKIFQVRVLRSATPDGRIDPGGRSWNALTAIPGTRPAAPTPAPAPTAAPLSGAAWWHANQARFPNSNVLSALADAFEEKASAFIAALKAAGATVNISATLRNSVRAQLMHYSWRIAKEGLAPSAVPAIPGCAIRWDHGDPAKSRKAAQEMVDLFGIVHAPSLTSLHITGRALDMTIGWSGTLRIKDKAGTSHALGAPRSGADNRDLHAIGASYGVRKLASDPPHWSDNGH